MKLILKASVFSLLFLCFNCSKDENEPIDPGTQNPSISAINPTSGPKNTLVTISGTNFGTDLSAIQVTFNGTSAAVQTVTETEITATVPAGAYTGIVSVTASGTAVNGPVFTYLISDISVSTLAGSIEGYTDASGASAAFNAPWGLARNSNGDIYVADRTNHVIRKVTSSGIVSTFAGTGTAGFADGPGASAQFDAPFGIDIDNNGTLYVADYNNQRIRKITPDGTVSTLAGNGSQGFDNGSGSLATFNGPLDLVVDQAGNVFVSDEQNDVIRLITSEGIVSTFAGSGIPGDMDGIATEARFTEPDGIAIDSNGNIYVADASNHKIKKITPNGDVSTLAGNGTPGAIDGTGSAAQFNTPTGLHIDADNNILVSGNFTHKIRQVSPTGIVTTIGGGTLGDMDGDITEATFDRPSDIVIGNNNTIYVSERGNHKIRKITQE